MLLFQGFWFEAEYRKLEQTVFRPNRSQSYNRIFKSKNTKKLFAISALVYFSDTEIFFIFFNLFTLKKSSGIKCKKGRSLFSKVLGGGLLQLRMQIKVRLS